jgi:hypothetical protein
MIPTKASAVPRVPPKSPKPSASCLGGSQHALAVTPPTDFSKHGAIVVAGAEIMPAAVGVTGLAAPPVQLEHEPIVMFERFAFWCTAPERGERRSWAAVARKFEIDAATVRAAAERYSWVDRSIAWDRRRVLGAAQRASELQAETAVSHVSLSQDLVDQCQVVIRRCDELIDAPALDLETLEAWQRLASGASKILEKAQKVARLAMNQSDSNTSIRVETKKSEADLDVSRLSGPELQLAMAYEQMRLVRMDGAGTGQLPDDVRDVLRFIEGR